MLALDRPTKSVVVAIRGTVTVADLATDMLADPEPMEEWLPRKMKTTVSPILNIQTPQRQLQYDRICRTAVSVLLEAVWSTVRNLAYKLQHLPFLARILMSSLTTADHHCSWHMHLAIT